MKLTYTEKLEETVMVEWDEREEVKRALDYVERAIEHLSEIEDEEAGEEDVLDSAFTAQDLLFEARASLKEVLEG